MNRIVIFGGTGFLGRKLSWLLGDEYSITVATRNAGRRYAYGENTDIAEIDNSDESYLRAVDNSYAVINLSGASIAGKRWNGGYKNILYNSRINTTKKITTAFAKCENKPRVFLSTSASGYYGDRRDEILTEESAPGNDFLAGLCSDWEKEAFRAEETGIRTVCIRIGVVLDKQEGALPRLVMPFKFFAGGRLGNGKQWMPWVHVDDVTGIFRHALNNESVNGPVNAVSPNPVTNKEFTKLVGAILHRPSLFPVPELALKIAVGEFAEFLLGGQRILPDKILKAGYKFRYETAEYALKNLLG
ncbi:MAG: TIGR01777 family oxidoreductase [Bacteroidetes bacterium]|nr:TIGR01777 family oxidoreductase [Bacteroidota bacterium]